MDETVASPAGQPETDDCGEYTADQSVRWSLKITGGQRGELWLGGPSFVGAESQCWTYVPRKHRKQGRPVSGCRLLRGIAMTLDAQAVIITVAVGLIAGWLASFVVGGAGPFAI
jgi:hypothetical protein